MRQNSGANYLKINNNLTFVKRHTSIFLQPFDDKWRDLNIASIDLTLSSISAEVSEENGMSLDG